MPFLNEVRIVMGGIHEIQLFEHYLLEYVNNHSEDNDSHEDSDENRSEIGHIILIVFRIDHLNEEQG